MYELLIRIETLALDAPVWGLLGAGLLALGTGLLLWLGGMIFSSILVGLLGAVVGAALGVLVSNWLELNLLISAAVGAAVLTLLAVLFKNVIVIVLAVIVFALAGGTGYMSTIFGEPPQQQESTRAGDLGYRVQSLSYMDRSARQDYLESLTEGSEQGFLDRFSVLMSDLFESVSPHGWKVILAVVGGAIVGLVLIWLLKRLILAVATSAVGAMLVIIGVQLLLLLFGVGLLEQFQGQRRVLPISYFVMVGVGALVQVAFIRRREHRLAKAQKEAKAD